MIIDYPCKINKENLGIRVSGYDYKNNKKQTLLLNPTDTEEIILTNKSSLSTEIFKLNPNITLSIFSKGKPSHFIIPSNNLPRILKNEELFNNLSKYKKNKLRWIFCKAVCSGRIKVISRLNETRNNLIVKEALEEMRKLDKKLINAKTREELMGLEGNIAKIFYFCLCEFNETFDKNFRTRDRNSKDIVNSLMNFSHTVLRNKISYRLILNGINPYHSFLHNNNRNQQYLTFDFAEFWIAYIDKIIFYSIDKEIIKETDIKENGYLNDKSKLKILKLIEERITNKEIDNKIKYFIGYLKGENKFNWK